MFQEINYTTGHSRLTCISVNLMKIWLKIMTNSELQQQNSPWHHHENEPLQTSDVTLAWTDRAPPETLPPLHAPSIATAARRGGGACAASSRRRRSWSSSCRSRCWWSRLGRVRTRRRTGDLEPPRHAAARKNDNCLNALPIIWPVFDNSIEASVALKLNTINTVQC